MARLIVTTQYSENYGVHGWRGKGPCPQDWRPKSHSEYVAVVDDKELASWGDDQVAGLLDRLAAKASYCNDYIKETPVDRGIVPAGCKTAAEQDFEKFLAKGHVSESERAMYSPTVIELAAISPKPEQAPKEQAPKEQASKEPAPRARARP